MVLLMGDMNVDLLNFQSHLKRNDDLSNIFLSGFFTSIHKTH